MCNKWNNEAHYCKAPSLRYGLHNNTWAEGGGGGGGAEGRGMSDYGAVPCALVFFFFFWQKEMTRKCAHIIIVYGHVLVPSFPTFLFSHCGHRGLHVTVVLVARLVNYKVVGGKKRKARVLSLPQPPMVVCKMEAQLEYVHVAYAFLHV